MADYEARLIEQHRAVERLRTQDVVTLWTDASSSQTGSRSGYAVVRGHDRALLEFGRAATATNTEGELLGIVTALAICRRLNPGRRCLVLTDSQQAARLVKTPRSVRQAPASRLQPRPRRSRVGKREAKHEKPEREEPKGGSRTMNKMARIPRGLEVFLRAAIPAAALGGVLYWGLHGEAQDAAGIAIGATITVGLILFVGWANDTTPYRDEEE